jgi:catechol 2,3-dioxygenase
MPPTPQQEQAPGWTPKSALIDRIERVDLRVQDVGRAVRFYSDVVGLKVSRQDKTHAALGTPDGRVILTLDSSGVTGRAVRRATGLFHTAIRFPDQPALGDALARLADAGLQIGGGDHAVSEALYVDDPDGNGVELYRDRPREAWPRPAPGARVPMTTEAVDFDTLLAAGRGLDAVAEPAPAGTDVGHVHLRVSDHSATRAFYADLLGLDVVADLGSAGFYSSGGYHHHIGANTWESLGAGPSPRTLAGLDRVVFAASSRAELDAVRVRLEEAGHAVDGSADELVVRDPDAIELRFVHGDDRG